MIPLLLVLSCKSATPPKDFGVNLTVDSTAIRNRDGLATLRVDVTGGETLTHDFDVRSIADSKLFRGHYAPAITTGQLTFSATLLASDGTVRGTGPSVTATLTSGQATDVTIALVDGEQPDGGADALPSECTNGQVDPGESDVDCSGTCPKCEPGRGCATVDDCATRTCVAGVCELATGTPGWVAVTSLPAARTAGAAAARDDGSVWMLGGYTTAIEASTLVYTGATNDWTAGAPLTEARMQMPAVVAGDQIFVVGGLTPVAATSDTLGSILHGAGATLAWDTLMRTLAIKRYAHGAALGSDGQIYVAGGLPAPAMPATADFVSFDPATDSSAPPTALAAMPAARSELGLAGDGSGHIVAAGGAGADAMATASTDIYSITTKAWVAGPPLLHARRNPGTVMGADGRIYTIGGNDDTAMSMEFVEALSLDGKRWSSIAPISPARTQITVVRAWDGRIFAIGGQTGGGGSGPLMPTTAVQAYGPRIVPGPAMGAPGAVIAVSGANFAKSANVTLVFSGDSQGVVAQQRTTNEMGQIAPSFVWTVPQVASGTYTLTVIDDKSRYPARARFVVP